MAISNESNNLLETSVFFRLPAGQSSTFEDQFVISASENDWIAADSLLVHDIGLAYKMGTIPQTQVENMAVALRRGSESAPKSSPIGSNPQPPRYASVALRTHNGQRSSLGFQTERQGHRHSAAG